MSSDGIQVGPGLPSRGLRFRLRPGHDKGFIIGLGLKSSAPADYKDIDYAVCCYSGGGLHVTERGSQKFTSPKKSSANSLIELRVTEGKVELWLDGENVGYIGSLQGPSTLHAMADIWDLGAEVNDIQWVGGGSEPI